MLTNKSKLVRTAKSMVKDNLRLSSWTVPITSKPVNERKIVKSRAFVNMNDRHDVWDIYAPELDIRMNGSLVTLFVNLDTLQRYGNQLASSTLKENRDFVQSKSDQIVRSANRFAKVLKSSVKKNPVAL